jgi:hypothetical protein
MKTSAYTALAWAPTARAVRLSALLLASSVFGCTGEGQRAGPVDPPRARQALRTALDHWKKGDRPESLQSATPSIVVQDFDWKAGQHLVAYEVTGDGKDDDANLRIPVKLTLRSPQGKGTQRRVSYVVGTSPTITVFRDFE